MIDIGDLHDAWAQSHDLMPIDRLLFEKKLSAKTKRRLKTAAVAAGASAATLALNPQMTRTSNRTGVRIGRGNYRAAVNRRPEQPATKKGHLNKPGQTTFRTQIGDRSMWATRTDAGENLRGPVAAKWSTGSRRAKPKTAKVEKLKEKRRHLHGMLGGAGAGMLVGGPPGSIVGAVVGRKLSRKRKAAGLPPRLEYLYKS